MTSPVRNEAPASVHSVLSSPGQPLAPATRTLLEPCFGMSFGHVRIHDDCDAYRSAEEINAVAYSVGAHVVLGAGRPALDSPSGRLLLAHELTHVVQQRSDPVTPGLRIGVDAAGSPEEAEAQTATRRIASGEHFPASRIRMAPTAVGRLHRLERGTYVSTVGEAAFLDAGAAFFRHWGYPNVRRVGSMEEVVSDLDSGRGHIDQFRLVSHGARGLFQFGFLQGVPTSLFGSNEAGFRSAKEFRGATAAVRLLDDATLSDELTDLIADHVAGPLLAGIGVTTVPDLSSTEGLYLRAVLEGHFLDELRLPTGAVPNISNRAVLNQWVQLRRTLYRPLVVASVPAAQQATTQRNLGMFEARVPVALQGRRTFQFPQADIDALATPLLDASQRGLNPEISRVAREGAGGTYVTKLARIRGRIDGNTHIEIRGCNVGGDTDFLDALRNHFGDAPQLPSVSAPDLFQYFFQVADVATFNFNLPPDQQRFAADYPNIEATFQRQERIRRREAWPVTNEESLADFARRYGRSATTLEELNPELQGRPLRRGELVWLVARPPIPAGTATSLEDFCDRELGNRYLWPRIWGYNPQLRIPTITPQDLVWIVSPNVRGTVAGPAATQRDLQTSLQGGSAFVGFAGGRTSVRLDNSQGAAAFSAWLAAQRYDAGGRNAAALARGLAPNIGLAVRGTHIEFLSPGYPELNVEDALFASDPRYNAHIVRRP